MSSPQNTSDEVEEIKNCPDRADEITTISNNDVENLNESPLNEGSIKFDAPFESKIEESLGCKGDMSIEPTNVENLELGCDDDFDDGIEILNEEALLNEGVELDEDIIKVQEEKNNIEIQNQEISLEEAEKITKKGLLTDTKDSQSLTSDILGQTQKVNKECEIDDNFQVILLEDEKELENESLVKEQNLCCIDENQKQEELNNITIDENEKIDTGVAAEGNTSTISQHSSYQQITEHGLNKPDMMLEIPTQELIEFSDESGDDEESAETTLKMSPDVEVIDIEENNCIDDNMINIEEERIVSTQENLLKSVDMDMTVLEDPKATIDALQAIDESHESCEDVNMEVTDCQNDISTNALSYEAEIAAEIITKEMNNINDETFTKNIDLIDQEDEEEKLTEELNSSLVSKPDKEISSKLILKETADADIIELSDDNIEIELEDSESSSGESLSDQKAKFKKAIASAELEEDILHDAEEIDNLILTTKISKTKIIEDSIKLSDNLSSSCTKTCEKRKLELTTNMNVSETKDSLEMSILNDSEEIDNLILTTKISKTKIIEESVKLSDNFSRSCRKTCEKNTLEPTTNVNVSATKTSQEISRQNANKTDTKPNKIAMDTSDEIPVSITAKNLDDMVLDKLSKKEDITDDVSNQIVLLPDNLQISTAEIKAAEVHITRNISYQPDNFKSPKESSPVLDRAGSVLATHPESNSKQNSASEEELPISKAPEWIKHTTEPIIQCDPILSSKINLVLSENSECENEKTQEIELNNASKLSSSNFEVVTEKFVTSEHNNEPVSYTEELMEVDSIEQSTCTIETASSETVHSKLSTLNIELKPSEMDEPKTSEIVESQPISKIDHDIPEMDRPQQTTSNIELEMTEIDGPQLSTAKIEQASEIDGPLPSKIESTTLEIIVKQPTSMIEQKPSEINEPSTSKIITPEISEPTSSSSKISSEMVITTPSESKIEPTTSAPVETAPPTLKIETITSEIDVLTPTTTNLEPITSETCRPTALPSKIEPTLSVNIDQKQSTSKIELAPSDPIPPQSSSSKIKSDTSETVEPQPTLKIEQITSEIDVLTPTTTNLEPITSETLRPTALPLRVEPTMSVNIDQKQSTSKIELVLSESLAPQSSSSKIESSTSETVEPQPSTSKIELQTSKSNEPQPSTSKIELETSESNEPQPSTSKIELQTSESNEPQPSISKCDTEAMDSKPSSPKDQSAFDLLIQDSSNDVPEMTDSLGLLAESSRVMEDDEEHDDDDDDDGDDEDDFEPDDESSNQMTAEHSEDSNTHQSESDVAKDAEMPNDENQGFDLDISESIIEKEPEKMVCDEDKADEITETEKAIDDEGLDNNEAENEIKAEVMDDETVKISDTSDTEDNENTEGGSTLKLLLLGKTPRKSSDSNYKEWTRTKKLSISKQCSNNVMSYVDLEESSSDEDKKQPQTKTLNVVTKSQAIAADGTSGEALQNEPTVVKEAETSSSESLQPALEKDVVKPKEPQVVARPKSPSSAVPPETHSKETEARSPKGLEVFSLDSDEEDSSVQQSTDDTAAVTQEPRVDQPKLRGIKCINRHCDNSQPAVGYYFADTSTAMYFEADTGKRAYVCEKCADMVEKRNQELIDGMRKFTPLFQLHTARHSEELVEISDSDSDGEPEPTAEQLQIVGTQGAKMLEEQLADMINETWAKFKMDDRILEAQSDLQKEMERLQKESQAIDAMFNECQAATDRLRNSLYATFDPDIQELPSIVIYDTPNCSYSCLEPPTNERRQYKRRLSPSKDTLETPAKKPATPSPATPVLPEAAPQDSSKEEQEPKTPVVEKVDDDNMDISVVTLAAESAPADLPPPGDLSHPPLKVGMTVYAMKNAFGTWLRAKVVEIQPKMHNMPFTMARVRFEHKVSKNPFKTLPARCLAYFEPSEVRMTIGTRVIALFKSINARQAYYSGIVAEIPNPVNNYRYLIFFDDGYAQYAPHSQTRLVCEFSSLVWEEVHPYSREFVRSYLLAYPERPMVRLHAGQNLKTEWRGKWWSSRVVSVDSSLVEVQFLRCDRREWIYRGSTRLAPLYLELQAAERHRPRALPRTQPRTQPQARINMPYVEYTRSDEQANKLPQTIQQRQQQLQQQNEELRRQRAVAKKSTALSMPPPQSNSSNFDPVSSRVVYYTPKNAVKPYKMTPHTCSPNCKRTDVLALKDLRTYNPLAKPLLSGWERQVVRYKGNKEVMYVAPCGRRLRDLRELHRYLRTVDSDMPVDLFDFSASTHCLAEFVLNKCLVGKKDLSHGKELVPVPCVNYYDESLPEFCSYNTERTPTAGVPLNLDPEFLCGCDCEDDCEDKTKCACWKMTLEGARTIGYEGDVGYVYRRLPEPLPSGIYECNSRCKCKNTCLNRVAQHPLQLKLQVFKTHNRGWGIRALNDVPKGAFLCIYAGNLLTDATANLDGLNEGDEYLAELDYIEVVEQMKEGFEEDIPDSIKAKDKKELSKKQAEDDDEDDEEEESSEEETTVNKNEREDGDFEPGYIGLGVAEFSKRLRKRDSKKEAEDAKQQEKEKEANGDDECITISDDEEVREPSCFTAAAGMGKNQFISKYRSVRTLFGEDEACYIMDAKVQGNIGRYLNHSCTPNVFVQNVFVDTHDPRFPWVAFFALHHIRAGTELTWNYNYDVGSVPGKVLYCFCGAPNCRGRLL